MIDKVIDIFRENSFLTLIAIVCVFLLFERLLNTIRAIATAHVSSVKSRHCGHCHTHDPGQADGASESKKP